MRSTVRTPAPPARSAARGPAARRPRAGGTVVGGAVLLATAASGDGGPAATLAFEDTTLVGRLLGQIADLGIREAHVLTRPEWTAALASAAKRQDIAVDVRGVDGTTGALQAVAELARGGDGTLVVANADILTQREALAGLIADPRVPTGMLTTTVRRVYRYVGLRTRTRRGRVVSAGTPYHYVHGPNGTFLGVLKIAPAERPTLAGIAERLAGLLDGDLPEGWQAELDHKAGRWKLALHRRAMRALLDPESAEESSDEALEAAADDGLEAQEIELGPAEAAELERRVAAAASDVPSLLLCGLVRSDVQVGGTHLRKLFWTRPLTADDVARAGARMGEYDEDKALLDSAVKASDGFFTTFFVSPYSRYIARFAANRGWTPNGVTTLSVFIGLLAAAGFATGERWGMIAGAVLLQLAFTFDCVDGQLARYTRTFTKLGAWLDSVFDRTKEYLVFAGLAIGAARTGDDVWLLAGAALTLQVMRHSIDFAYPQAQHQAMALARQPPLEQVSDSPAGAAVPAPLVPEGELAEAPPPQPRKPLKRRVRDAWRGLDRSHRAVWVKKIIGFPIGERFAAISIAAALFDARVTFIVLLAWGGFAATYTVAGRVLRSIGRRGALEAAPATAGTLDAYRDDGPLALALGRIAPRGLPASGLVLAALALVLAAIVVAGDDASWWLAGGVLVVAVLLAAASAGRPLRDRMRWTVPPALRVLEYAGILWAAALAGPSSVPAAFALLAAITFRHYDIVYRIRQRSATPPRWLNRGALGWDGRLLIAFGLAAAAAVPAGYYAAAVVLAAVFVAEAVHSWLSYGRTQQPEAYDDEEENAE
jgi:phosphatidylglycerophosphate synthase